MATAATARATIGWELRLDRATQTVQTVYRISVLFGPQPDPAVFDTIEEAIETLRVLGLPLDMGTASVAAGVRNAVRIPREGGREERARVMALLSGLRTVNVDGQETVIA